MEEFISGVLIDIILHIFVATVVAVATHADIDDVVVVNRYDNRMVTIYRKSHLGY